LVSIQMSWEDLPGLPRRCRSGCPSSGRSSPWRHSHFCKETPR
jgi:hypothetical protein